MVHGAEVITRMNAEYEAKPLPPVSNSYEPHAYWQARPLAEGCYWITFPVGDKQHTRRTVVALDAHGVTRCRWADANWQAYPPLSVDDIGLRVDQMDDAAIQFQFVCDLPAVDAGSSVAVDSAQDVAPESTASSDPSEVVTDEQSQATRRALLDSNGSTLKPGRYYLMAGNGSLKPVKISEDQLTFDLWIEQEGKRQRVDELPESAVLVPHDGSWTD